MRSPLLSSLISSFACALSAVNAQIGNFLNYQNPFKIPARGISMKVGEPVQINWVPTTPGTVTLVLRSGRKTRLREGIPVAERIKNSGSLTWTPPPSVSRGNDYTLEIISDAHPDQTNYTPYFVIDSDNLVRTASTDYLYGAPTAKGGDGLAQLTPTSTANPTGTLGVEEATTIAYV